MSALAARAAGDAFARQLASLLGLSPAGDLSRDGRPSPVTRTRSVSAVRADISTPPHGRTPTP
ncbi:hypothetical protein [Streptomyces sp. NPDC093795]|uniref:hypothetical protein n=1 Tax=Streptomyces sp. NPDC093795 TaxID=3366051 RepID=UPI00380DC5D9